MMSFPKSMPNDLRNFLQRAVNTLSGDSRLIGIAAGGSYLTDSMDEFSDLDLILVTQDQNLPTDVPARLEIARSLGDLLSGFTGDHVGEPRLLICLYGNPLLHVDLKFVLLEDISKGVEKPAVIWERDGQLSVVLEKGTFSYPAPDAQWIEDRFWVWVHYGAVKIRRGELFEALDMIGFLRARVLGPLALQSVGKRPNGLRKIEVDAPEFAEKLHATIPQMNRGSCKGALQACADLYLSLRGRQIEVREQAQKESLEYLQRI